MHVNNSPLNHIAPTEGYTMPHFKWLNDLVISVMKQGNNILHKIVFYSFIHVHDIKTKGNENCQVTVKSKYIPSHIKRAEVAIIRKYWQHFDDFDGDHFLENVRTAALKMNSWKSFLQNFILWIFKKIKDIFLHDLLLVIKNFQIFFNHWILAYFESIHSYNLKWFSEAFAD